MKVTILYQLKVGNTVSKRRWGYILQHFCEVSPPAPKPISYLPVYSMKRIALASSQGLALFGFFPYTLIIFPIIIDHWSMMIYNKALILKYSLILSNTNTKIWSKKWVDFYPLSVIMKSYLSTIPYVTKMFFLQSSQMDEGFWLYWCLIQKCLN